MTDDGALEKVPVAPGNAPRCDLGGTTACLKALERGGGWRKEAQEQLSTKLVEPFALQDWV